MVFCIMLGLGAALSAQTFHQVERRNPWNSSRNVAGILKDSLSRSYAEIYGNYGSGEFRDTWQAPRQWSAGAVTRSLKHLEKVSLTGSFSFDQIEGYDMCGSMFIEPGYFPVDVLEFTPGRKTLQTYSFDGGLAYEVNDRWAIGAKIDFASSNLAKRKDLRHSNWRLDMTVAPGFTTYIGDVAVGLAALFNKTSETVDAEQIGTSESSYYAFFDKSLMYGVEQVWTGSGVHLNESGVNGLPVRELSYGGALQMQYKDLYLDVEYLFTDGAVGEKEYIWFDYAGQNVAAAVKYTLRRPSSEHHFSMHGDWKMQDVDENVLEKVSGNGVTIVIDHGANRIYSREIWSLSPKYEYVSKMLEATASVDVDCENGLASQIYPYVNMRSLMNVSAEVSALFHLGRWDLGARLGYAEGNVYETESLVSDKDTALTAPYRLQDWYDRHIEYLTAPRIGAGMSVRFNFHKGMYVEAAGDWMHGFGIRYLSGADRFGASLKVGYTF